VFLSTLEGTLYCFKSDGKLSWQEKKNATSAPVVWNGECYFSRRDQTTAPLVEKRRYRGKALPDGFNIDHHHNIWYRRSVVNLYFTLSKVDSIISGQALSSSRANSGIDCLLRALFLADIVGRR